MVMKHRADMGADTPIFPMNTSEFKENHNDNDSEMSQWVCLSEAARSTPYSAEYLSLLARRNKLPAKKIQGVWYTTRKIVNDYLSKQMVRKKFELEEKNQNFAPMFQNNLSESLSGEVVSNSRNDKDSQGVNGNNVRNGADNYGVNNLDSFFNSFIAKFDKYIDLSVEKRVSFFGHVVIYVKNSYRTVVSRKLTLFLFILLLLVAVLAPFRLVSGFAENTFRAVIKTLKDANTVLGFRPGTHENEILLLNDKGDVSIFGHIETEGQFRSFIKDGIAPIVVDSKTKVGNLNADYLDNLSAEQFTLAFVTKNGNVTH